MAATSNSTVLAGPLQAVHKLGLHLPWLPFSGTAGPPLIHAHRTGLRISMEVKWNVIIDMNGVCVLLLVCIIHI